ncbi:response regulator transcription factor [Paenibacillus sp. IB182496]|uniref:Response regulator transcription factor n=1 Tax=Paenibacillus sabuli TaxID=2772509 RepID=A0A927GTJ5_9BACL|nr:response regulator transcription factor [Paenibacillus sabuli]MBD2846797.1 response regulator transcription factor [Paenibacillus sabuli]
MKKILIIEDETSIAELERDYLEIHGFQVELADSGEQGLELALARDFDLIVLDLMLPQVDGFEICRQIRQTKDIPVLMVTARKEEIDKIRGLGLGADDYMTKPFSPGELVARVKAHLSRYERLLGARDGRSEQIRVRGLIIDKPSRRVFVNEQEAVLTSKEYELLQFMALHPNRVFTKEELFERLWGLESSGDLTTVTVHIRRIREKVERDPSTPEYIETIWGVGYRFKP